MRANYYFHTGCKLSRTDDGVKMKINVSFFKPSDNTDRPVEGFVAASRQCDYVIIDKSQIKNLGL